MLSWRGALAAMVFAACSQPNPAYNCADGHCSDPSYPYCDSDGAIMGQPGTCIAVTCTPGEFGACHDTSTALVCNASGNGYDELPCTIGCDSGKGCSTTCTKHSQCPSGICKLDHTCAVDSEITFVSGEGPDAAECTRISPCSLARAVQVTPGTNGQYIELAAGQYTITATLQLSGKRIFVGRGAPGTRLRSSGSGAIFELMANSEVWIDSFQVSNNYVAGANRFGVNCPDTPAGTRVVHAIDALFSDNQGGINNCTFGELVRSRFTNGSAVILSGASVDRSYFDADGTGLQVIGNFSVTNSFFVRNQTGIALWGATNTPVFAFNTIADNTLDGIECSYFGQYAPVAGENNIIARNQTNTNGIVGYSNNCTFSGSIIATNVLAIRFVSADIAPYNYHLASGSSAIDAAMSSTLDHDYDGDARPKGAGRDVGADEAF